MSAFVYLLLTVWCIAVGGEKADVHTPVGFLSNGGGGGGGGDDGGGGGGGQKAGSSGWKYIVLLLAAVAVWGSRRRTPRELQGFVMPAVYIVMNVVSVAAIVMVNKKVNTIHAQPAHTFLLTLLYTTFTARGTPLCVCAIMSTNITTNSTPQYVC